MELCTIQLRKHDNAHVIPSPDCANLRRGGMVYYIHLCRKEFFLVYHELQQGVEWLVLFEKSGMKTKLPFLSQKRFSLLVPQPYQLLKDQSQECFYGEDPELLQSPYQDT